MRVAEAEVADRSPPQIHTVNSDSRCQDLVTLLEKDRARDFITTRQQIAYRMEAEAAIGSEDPLYRIEWVRFRSLVLFSTFN